MPVDLLQVADAVTGSWAATIFPSADVRFVPERVASPGPLARAWLTRTVPPCIAEDQKDISLPVNRLHVRQPLASGTALR